MPVQQLLTTAEKMASALDLDLKRLQALAYHRADWSEEALRHYHAAIPNLDSAQAYSLRRLYSWMFVPITLWPFNIQDVLEDCLAALEKGKRLTPRHRLLIDFLPVPPDETICAAVAAHELHVQKGTYENIVRTQAKYAQNELANKTSPELHRQWKRLKAAFNVKPFRDYKGVIRRTMGAERNLRPSFSVNCRRRADVFQAAFDAFCLRWNLYGMQNDEPLLLKLAVNLTPYGTMIHIPAYWSFDPKRDIRWEAIAKLHRTRVPGRQGSALAAGLAQRMHDAAKLRHLDQEAHQRRLKGEKRHEFLCAGLGWDPRTSPKRLSRLRAEFKNRRAHG
ncbi:MAG TPA: hypothetical protein VGW37_11590 [Terriglobia bacterium]|nr:hypothetical protein [Terriglobia bacterium]